MISVWKNLESDICLWIKEQAPENVTYRNSHQSIIGFPPDGCRSDGMVTDDHTLVSIEVEAGQTHPDTNTGKYWLLYDSFKKYEKIILFFMFILLILIHTVGARY